MQSKPLTLASNAAAATVTAPDVPGRDTALREALQLLTSYMQDPTITEVCINRPGEVFTESNYGWQRHDVNGASLAWCKKLAQLTATFSAQKVNEKEPILSATLPDGERIQVVIPPAVEHGTVAVTIRKPSIVAKTRDEFEREGLTDEVADQLSALSADEERLVELKAQRKFWEFFELAVKSKKNIVIAGATGSGKTTFAKAILNYIPTHERIITIEDVREMFLPNHDNRVHLLYLGRRQRHVRRDGEVLAAMLPSSEARPDPARRDPLQGRLRLHRQRQLGAPGLDHDRSREHLHRSLRDADAAREGVRGRARVGTRRHHGLAAGQDRRRYSVPSVRARGRGGPRAEGTPHHGGLL